MRIDHLVNHYDPLLMRKVDDPPVTGEELEQAIEPVLLATGWQKDENFWSMDSSCITFDPEVIDEEDRRSELITAFSGFSWLLEGAQPIPGTWEVGDRKVHRIGVGGLMAYIVEENDVYRVVNRMKDFEDFKGRSFGSLDEARAYVSHTIQTERQKFLQSQSEAWTNRLDSWKMKVKM